MGLGLRCVAVPLHASVSVAGCCARAVIMSKRFSLSSFVIAALACKKQTEIFRAGNSKLAYETRHPQSEIGKAWLSCLPVRGKCRRTLKRDRPIRKMKSRKLKTRPTNDEMTETRPRYTNAEDDQTESRPDLVRRSCYQNCYPTLDG